MDANEVLLEIRRDYGLDIQISDARARTAVANLTRTVERACHNLSEELYTKITHFILELIQNADDNTYADGSIPTLAIRLDTDCMDIQSNEMGFSEANIRAICKIGGSTKTDKTQGFIGEKGIGFKAVFTVADVVTITSGKYAFKFDRTQPLGMIAPIPLNDGPSPDQPGTTIRLALSSPRVQHPKLISHLREIKPTLLLFLKKLRHLDVSFGNTSYSMSKESPRSGITRIKHGAQWYNYRLFTQGVAMGDDEKRKGISRSDIVLAFPVCDDDTPIITNQDVYAFVALRSYGFSFIIQADFLTAASREDILADRAWNQTLRDAIPTAFANAVTRMLNHPALRYTWVRYIPFYIADTFFRPLCARILQRLQGEELMFGEDGRRRRPSCLIISPQRFRDDDGCPLIPSIRIRKYYLSSGYDVNGDGDILQKMGIQTMSDNEFLEGLKSMGQQITSQPAQWKEKVYTILRDMVRNNRHFIRNLSLVPLADGSWTSVHDDVVFNLDLSDIPQGLELRLIAHLEPSSTHYKLLSELGVKKADPSTVVTLLQDLHSRRGSLEHYRAALPSHAWFVFNHHSSSSARSFTLQVVTTNNSILSASEAYMDHPALSSPSLSGYLSRSSALFLHRDYDSYQRAVPAERFLEWKNWLHRKMQVSITPKIYTYPKARLSDEFRLFLTSATTDSVLQLLTYMSDELCALPTSSDALKELKGIPVVTTDRVSRPLETTYIRRRSLTRLGDPDLPFLPISDPESPRWEYLRKLGVSFEVNSGFYLKQLIRLSQRKDAEQYAEQDTKKMVSELYKQLDARFNDDGLADAIRAAFKEKRLIYVTAHRPPLSRWILSTDAVWDGPRTMRLKAALCMEYPTLEGFFCDQIELAACPEDILLQELRVLCSSVGDAPLDAKTHERVHDILHEISGVVRAVTVRHGPSRKIDWLRELRELQFVSVALPLPAEGKAQEFRLMQIDGECYVPENPDGPLAHLFRDAVPMLSQPPDNSSFGWGALLRLFRSEWLAGVKFLEPSIKQDVEEDDADARTPNVTLSNHYKARVPFLARTICDHRLEESARRSINLLRDIGVYDLPTSSVVNTYTLGSIVRKQSAPLGIQVVNNRCIILIGSGCPTTHRHIQVGIELQKLFPVFPRGSIAQIFGSTLEAIEMIFPDAPMMEDEPEDKSAASWLPSAQNKTPKKAQAGVVARQTAASTPGNSILTVEREVNALLSQDIPRLRQASERQSLSAATVNLELAYSLKKMVLSGVHTLSNGDSQTTATVAHTTSSYHGGAIGGSDNLTYIETTSSQFQTRVQQSFAQCGLSIGVTSRPFGDQEYTGILGEIYVFLQFKNSLPNFTETSWTSALRTWMGFDAFVGESKADFTYPDHLGTLTELLFGEQVKEKWSSTWPTYHLEVKSSSCAADTPFHATASQLRNASAMSLRSDEIPPAIYVLVRVSSVRTQPEMVMYPDPWRCLFDGTLQIVSDVEMKIAD